MGGRSEGAGSRSGGEGRVGEGQAQIEGYPDGY